MTEQNTGLAGVGDGGAALAGDGDNSRNYLTEDAAALSIENLLGPDDEDEEEQGAASPDPEPEQLSATDEDAQPEEDSEPPIAEDEEKIAHGNAKVILRDNRKVSVAELKLKFERAEELEAREQEWNSQQAQFREHAQRTAQQTQHTQQVLQHAIAIQKSALGNPPDPSLRETDPIEYFTQKDRFDQKRAELGQLLNAQQLLSAQQQQEQQKAQQQTEAQRQTQLQSFVQEQQRALTEKIPELKSPEKAKEFYGKLVTGAKDYGFTPDEVNNVFDHRLVVMMKDAMAYQALQKGKPVAQQKAKQAAPVQAPGRRVTPNEAQSREHAGQMDRLRKSGSMDDAASILMKYI